jgi:hypothetical protein
MYHTSPGEIGYTAISYAWESDYRNEETVDIPLIDVVDVERDDGLLELAFSDQQRQFLRVKKFIWKMILSVAMVGDNDGLEGCTHENIATALWIDQICIDQSNNAEKSNQVKKMHHIYEKAENTIVYLGEPSKDTDVAIEAAYALAALKDVNDDKIPLQGGSTDDGWAQLVKHLNWAAIKNISTYEPLYFELKQDDKQTRPFRALAMDIFRRRWFQRTWVLGGQPNPVRPAKSWAAGQILGGRPNPGRPAKS